MSNFFERLLKAAGIPMLPAAEYGEAGPTMVKLVIAVKRNPNLSPEQFRAHLGQQHAALVRACPATAKYVRKYVQSYALPGRPDAPEPAYDGVAELWFDTAADMDLFFTDPDYLTRVRPDEDRFADLARCAFFVTHERRIV